MSKSNEEKALERIEKLYKEAQEYYKKKGINISGENKNLVVFAYLAEQNRKTELDSLIELLVKGLKEKGQKFDFQEFRRRTYDNIFRFLEDRYPTEEVIKIFRKLGEVKENKGKEQKGKKKVEDEKGGEGKKKGKEGDEKGKKGKEKVEEGKPQEKTQEKTKGKTKGGTKVGKGGKVEIIDESVSEEIIKTFFSTENLPKNVAVPKKSSPLPPYIVRFQNDEDFYKAFTEFLIRKGEDTNTDKIKGIFQKLLHPEIRLRKDPPIAEALIQKTEDPARGAIREVIEMGEGVEITGLTKAEGKFRVWDNISKNIDDFIKEYESHLKEPEFLQKADINKQIAQKFLKIVENRVGKNSFPPYLFHYEDIGGGIIRTAVSFKKEFIDFLSQLPEAKVYFTEGILHHFLDTVDIPDEKAILWMNSTFLKENNELIALFSADEVRIRKLLNLQINKIGTLSYGQIVSSKDATKPLGILKIIREGDFPEALKKPVDELIEKYIEYLRKMNNRLYVPISALVKFTAGEDNTIKATIGKTPSSTGTPPSGASADIPSTPSTPGSPPSKPPKKINPRDVPIEVIRKIRAPYILGATGALVALYLLLRKKEGGEKIELPYLELPTTPTSDISFQEMPPITINIDVENTIAKMAEAFRRKAEQKKAQLVKRIEQAYIMTQVQSALFNMYKPETKVSFHESIIISLYAEANKYDEKTKLAMLRGLMYAKQNNITYTSPEELLAYSHLPLTEKSNEAIQSYIDYQNRMAQILQFEFQKDYETYINLTKEATKWRIKAQELQQKINTKIELTNFMLRFKKEVEEAKRRAFLPSLEVITEGKQ